MGATCKTEETIKLFEHVEITKFGEACVIYNVKNEQNVETLLGNLRKHTREAFVPEEIIFDDNQTVTSAVTDISVQERTYADALRSFYTNEVIPTHEVVVHESKRKMLYYGNSDENVQFARLNHLDERNNNIKNMNNSNKKVKYKIQASE